MQASRLTRPWSSHQRLYAALQASETLAARGTEAVALQAKVDSLQAELNTSYAACAQAATALKSAREAQAQADKRQRALSSEVATLRADLAASRERVAELVAAVCVSWLGGHALLFV